jgi:glycosyltransferase involved in cell wall biosynthesis
MVKRALRDIMFGRPAPQSGSEVLDAAPLTSVITNSYNAHRFLRANVESMLRQQHQRWEHIVVDCGSNDGSLDLLDSLAHPRLRVLRVPFCGVAKGRRIGINEARGDLVAILDADDCAMPDRLARQVRVFAERPEVVACGAGIVELNERTGREKTYLYPRRHEALVRLLMTAFNPLPHSTLMFRRSAFAETGGYSEVFEKSEDFDLLLRLARVGRLTSIARPLVRYTVHADSHTYRHRPKGRDAAYYATLASILHGLDDSPDVEKPSVEAVMAFLDGLGPEGIRALCARWARSGMVASLRELDVRALRYQVAAQAHGLSATLRHREDWWAYSSSPATVATRLVEK